MAASTISMRPWPAMTCSLPRTACMSANGCQRRVSAGMCRRLPAADAAVLDVVAARDEHVSDDLGREQPVLDDSRDRVEPRSERGGIVERAVEIGDHAAVGRGWRAGADAGFADGPQR